MQKQNLMQTTANVIQELEKMQEKMQKQMKITPDANNDFSYLGKNSS